MASRVFVACAKSDCRWHEDGQCSKSEIYVDDGVMCASYEPDISKMLGSMMGVGGPAMGPDPRSLLLQQMAGSPPPPSLPPGMSQPPLPLGGMDASPTAAPPPLRF